MASNVLYRKSDYISFIWLYKLDLTVLHVERDTSLYTNQYRKTSSFDESYKVLSSGLIYEPLLWFVGVVPFHDGDWRLGLVRKRALPERYIIYIGQCNLEEMKVFYHYQDDMNCHQVKGYGTSILSWIIRVKSLLSWNIKISNLIFELSQTHAFNLCPKSINISLHVKRINMNSEYLRNLSPMKATKGNFFLLWSRKRWF